MTGKVYIASMKFRGKHASPICKSPYIKVNVTSCQAKNNVDRIAFSPMTEVEDGYKGYYNFESQWQSGKVFEGISIEETKNFWKNVREPKKRYPKSKNKKVLYAKFDDHYEKMDYITSRKKVYVPSYYNYIKYEERIEYLKNRLKEGDNIVIYDLDGPKDKNNDVQCLELTNELLIDKINDIRHPFGHGYIVGATVAGIKPSNYTNN